MLIRHPNIQLFTTGPEQRENNSHHCYCRLCRVQLSLKSRVYQAIQRHFQTRDHLKKDQRYRLVHPRMTV